MKLVFRSLLLHFTCIVLFTMLYVGHSGSFVYPDISGKEKLPIGWLDCFYLATTVQAGVGYASMIPLDGMGRWLMIMQQFLMIASNVMTLYIFTL